MDNTVTTLHHVEAFTPDRKLPVEEYASLIGLNRYQARMFRRIRGLAELPFDPELDLFELLGTPARALLRSAPVAAESIRYLILAHTFQELTPSNVVLAEELARRLGLPNAEPFAVTQQNCSSALAAVDIAGELLRAGGDPEARALIVTGEKPFTRVVSFIINTSLMGEASAACLVGLGGDGPRVRSYAVKVEGRFSDGWRMPPEPLREFGNTYNTYLIEVMQEALQQSGLGLDDIAMVIPHNVNLSSWLRLCNRIGLDRKRVFLENIEAYSHCFCSDPFLNMITMRDRGLLEKGKSYLITTVGLGAIYAAMVVDY